MRYLMNMVWAILIIFFLCDSYADDERNPALDQISLPPGFNISVYAENVPDARSMALGADGVVYVGTLNAGRVYAVIDNNKDYKADEVVIVDKGLYSPNAVAYYNGALYVAQANRILRYDDITSNVYNAPQPVIINNAYLHGIDPESRYIYFRPDGRLYMPIGTGGYFGGLADMRYISTIRMLPDGTQIQAFAYGVNPDIPGFGWYGISDELTFAGYDRSWFYGEGIVPRGWGYVPYAGYMAVLPNYYQNRQTTDAWTEEKKRYDEMYRPSSSASQTQIIQPQYIMALGMRSYTGGLFPDIYRNRVFIIEQDLWRYAESSRAYRISTLSIMPGQAPDYEVFAEGWGYGPSAWGRPVDLLMLPDGSMLVSDDRAGVIYRISYESD